MTPESNRKASPTIALPDMLRDYDVYVGYSFLLIAHRNQANGYAEMLESTRTLRRTVEAAIQQ